MSSKREMFKQMGKAKQGRKKKSRGAGWLAYTLLESWSWGVFLAAKSHPAPVPPGPSFAFLLVLLPVFFPPKAPLPNTASPRAGSVVWAPGARVWQRTDEVVSVHPNLSERLNLHMLFHLRQP